MAEPQLASEADDDSDDPRALETLVGDWSYLPDIAERYGVALSRVRRFLADRELLTHRVGPNRALAVPTDFLGPDGPRPELKGTFTVLADGGMSDVEIIRWHECATAPAVTAAARRSCTPSRPRASAKSGCRSVTCANVGWRSACCW